MRIPLDSWWLMCGLGLACTPANKVAEELPQGTEYSGPSDSDHETDTPADDCVSGGGDQPCAAVTACEAGCDTDAVCRDDCVVGLCSAHVPIYCDMAECIDAHCEEICRALGDADCGLCLSIYCAAGTAVCSTAYSCDNEDGN